MRTHIGIEMLEIKEWLLEQERVIHPTLIWDEKGVVLLDTGYPGQVRLFQQKLSDYGFELSDLVKILLTHQDIDHIGSLPNLIESNPSTEVYASLIEKPYIEGNKQILKFNEQALAQIDQLPEAIQTHIRRLAANLPKAPVHHTIKDGEILSIGGGLQVIETPGHTPGHISFYHIPSKTLIAGDALFAHEGEFILPDPAVTYDMEQAKDSIRKLTNYEIETVICYHGGMVQGNILQKLQQLP